MFDFQNAPTPAELFAAELLIAWATCDYNGDGGAEKLREFLDATAKKYGFAEFNPEAVPPRDTVSNAGSELMAKYWNLSK